jgi:hypothetical protein
LHKKRAFTGFCRINLRRFLDKTKPATTVLPQIMNALKLSAIIIFTHFVTYAQNDSIVSAAGKAITDRFPSTRTFDVQYSQFTPTDYYSELFGDAYEKGHIQNHYRLKASVNFPLWRYKKLVLTNSFRYKYEAFESSEVYDPNNILVNRPKQDFHYFAESIGATYFSTLFKKPVIYSVAGTVDGNEMNIQRIKGLASAIIVLKRTENTTITVGVVGLLDRSAIIPIAPVFTYQHNFRSGWQLDFIMPKSLLMRKDILKNGRLAIGTELNSESFYLELPGLNPHATYEYNQLEINSGLSFEYHLNRNLILSFKTGFNNVLDSKITESGKKTNDYILDTKQDPQFYVNLGFSYNIFKNK